MEHLFVGGPFDGQHQEVPGDALRVAVPFVGIKGTEREGASLAELEPEVRFDPETWAIIAPAELVLEYRLRYYERSGVDFVFVN